MPGATIGLIARPPGLRRVPAGLCRAFAGPLPGLCRACGLRRVFRQGARQWSRRSHRRGLPVCVCVSACDSNLRLWDHRCAPRAPVQARGPPSQRSSWMWPRPCGAPRRGRLTWAAPRSGGASTRWATQRPWAVYASTVGVRYAAVAAGDVHYMPPGHVISESAMDGDNIYGLRVPMVHLEAAAELLPVWRLREGARG